MMINLIRQIEAHRPRSIEILYRGDKVWVHVEFDDGRPTRYACGKDTAHALYAAAVSLGGAV